MYQTQVANKGIRIPDGVVSVPLNGAVVRYKVWWGMSGQRETRVELGGALIAVVVSVILCAVAVGLWLGPVAAVIVTVGFALAVIAGLLVWSTRRPRPMAAEAPHVHPVDDGRYRILVIADESCMTPGFIEELRKHAAGRHASVFVTAPALESRLGLLAGDQGGYEDAARRLDEMLAALRSADLEAQGTIGASDPLQSADDGLRRFPANEVLFVTHPDTGSTWLETGVVAQAEERYEQPVKHVVVQDG